MNIKHARSALDAIDKTLNDECQEGERSKQTLLNNVIECAMVVNKARAALNTALDVLHTALETLSGHIENDMDARKEVLMTVLNGAPVAETKQPEPEIKPDMKEAAE